MRVRENVGTAWQFQTVRSQVHVKQCLSGSQCEANLGVQGCKADLVGALSSPQQQVLVVDPACGVHKSIGLAVDDGGVVCRSLGLQLWGVPCWPACISIPCLVCWSQESCNRLAA